MCLLTIPRILMSFIGIYNLEHTVPMDIFHISVAWKFHWNIHNLYTFRYVVHSFTELVSIKGQETHLGDPVLSYGQPQTQGSTEGSIPDDKGFKFTFKTRGFYFR